jgi:predicted transcriptional regulator
MDANEKVLTTMKKAGKELKAGEIAEMSGLDKKDVDKAIKKLTAEGKVHSPKRCYFGLK